MARGVATAPLHLVFGPLASPLPFWIPAFAGMTTFSHSAIGHRGRNDEMGDD